MFREKLKQHWIEYSLIGVWFCNCVIAGFIAVQEVWIPHMDAGGDSYTHIRSTPFDGTVMPITYIPDWTKTENQDKTKRFEDIAISEYLPLPTYDSSTLIKDLNNTTKISTILHYTYTVPYMGSYRFNYKEHDGSHLWVDIRAPIGTPILSIANWVVTRTVEADATGNKFVVIRHDDVPVNGKKVSLYSSYLHLSQITVTEWTKIMKWEMLGRVGNTGISTAPHLHFQIDTAEAPFHPYWPFTSADSRTAGLGFFESINAWLGRDNALKYTIHPMGFVNKHLWGVVTSSIVSQNQSNNTPVTVISETLTDDALMREREIMLGAYQSSDVKTCEKKRFSDVKEATAFWKSLYKLVDENCLFQKGGIFNMKESVTKREVLISIMDYYKIEPATGTSHFLDVSIDDPLQGYAVVLYRQWIVDGNYLVPEKIMSKAEVIDMIVKIGWIPKNPSQIRIYSDTQTLHPYYESIQAYWFAMKARSGRIYPDTIMNRGALVQILGTLAKIQK